MKDQLGRKITEKTARVGVIGLGYVGLPLAVEFSRGGLFTTGFEVDESKAAEINSGRSYVGDVASSLVKDLIDSRHLTATMPRVDDSPRRESPIAGIRGASAVRREVPGVLVGAVNK